MWTSSKLRSHIADANSPAAWIFGWMLSLEGSFPENIVSSKIYPRTIDWCNRYQKAVSDAQEAAKPEVIEGDEAIKRINAAQFAEDPHGVDSTDPLGLKEGQQVTLSPRDTGFTRSESGPLVAITKSEIVVASKTKAGTTLHIHTPRWNFRVRAAESNGTNGA